MIVYHASNVIVTRPDITYSRDNLDFGKGFYLTTLQEQAINYALRFKRRNQKAWLNVYALEFCSKEWKILKFESYDSNWLEFISKCRAGDDNFDYDMVIGGIANDKVIRTLDRYFAGELSSEQALGILKYEKPNIQYCIRSQKMLDLSLKHIESKEL